MNPATALQIITTLTEGVDPCTGESFPADHVCQSNEVVGALFAAKAALEKEVRPSRVLSGAPNAGKAWTPSEDERLAGGFKAGHTPSDLARMHGRTVAGIEARLETLGLIPAKR